ncbi:MAG: hypothetical protein IJ731_09845 [Eubacterium sp.]|nr:hypothetical protein [Eubacterium sp.]
MEEYKLGSDEVVLVEPFYVSLEDKKTGKFMDGELMLTNEYLIWARDPKRSLFHGKQVFPLEKIKVDRIKIYDGIPQVKINTSEYDALLIYLKNKTMSFEYYEVEDAQKFINAINKLLTGNEVVFQSGNAIKGSEQIADKIAGTVNAFKNAFGIKPQEQAVNKPISKNCKGCGAVITGIQGKSVKCPYCDTVQEL